MLIIFKNSVLECFVMLPYYDKKIAHLFLYDILHLKKILLQNKFPRRSAVSIIVTFNGWGLACRKYLFNKTLLSSMHFMDNSAQNKHIIGSAVAIHLDHRDCNCKMLWSFGIEQS